MKKRKTAAFMTALAISLCVPQTFMDSPYAIVAEAHSGRTDSNGGHRDNKNRSGLGSYHYHCGGHPAHLHPHGVCPYSSTASSAADSSAQQSSAGTSHAPAVPDNISFVFDPEYYADHNEDLYEAFGHDKDQLLNHFLTYGMKEGRTASESFNVTVYKENNPDLVNAYGDDMTAYYSHYMDCGHNEGRICH